MAIAPQQAASKTPEEVLAEQKVQEQMADFNGSFNIGLMNAVKRANDLITVTYGPSETDADIDLRAARTLLSAHMKQVNDTVSVRGDFTESASRRISENNGPDVPYEQLNIKVEPFEVSGANIDTYVGGRAQTAVRTYGGDNKAGQRQYDVSEFTTPDESAHVKIKMATAADGALNSYAVAYITQLDESHPEYGMPYSTMLDDQKIITRANDVAMYNKEQLESQKARQMMGLSGDDILRDEAGLPHISQPLDNFYANLPERHPYHGITPYKDAENEFLREMQADLLDKQMRHDYAELLQAAQKSGQSFDGLEVPASTSFKLVNDKMRLVFSAKENTDLNGTSIEEQTINANRTTHRSASEIASFLNTDPQIKQRAEFIAQSIAEDGPQTILREAANSDYKPSYVNYGTMAFDTDVINPNKDKYLNLTEDSTLVPAMRDVDFNLSRSKSMDSLILVQDNSNYDLAEKIFGENQLDLINQGIATQTTGNLGQLNRKNMLPTMRSFYVQVANERNDPEKIKAGEDYKQTVVLASRIASNQIKSNPATSDALTKINTAIIPPGPGYTSWPDFLKIKGQEHTQSYLQDRLVDFANERSSLLNLDNKATPMPAVASKLSALVADTVLSEEYSADRAEMRSNRVLSLDEQIEKFETNLEKTMAVLKNATVKNTLTSMMGFAKDNITQDPELSAPFDKMRVLLAEDFNVNKGSSNEMNTLAMGVIGKMLIDSHLRQSNPDYEQNADHQRYDQPKLDAATKLVEHITNDENFPHSRRAQVANTVGTIVTDLMQKYPDVDNAQNQKMMSVITFAAQQLDVERQSDKFGVKPTGLEAKAVAPEPISPSVKPLNLETTTEFDVQDIKRYSDIAASDKGLFAKNADLAAMFTAKPPKPIDEPNFEPLEVQKAAYQVTSHPEFQKLKEKVLNGEPYKIPGARPLMEVIPELQFFHQDRQSIQREKEDLKRGIPVDRSERRHHDAQDLKEIGAAQPASAASELGLSFVVARAENAAALKFDAKKHTVGSYLDAIGGTEIKAADYPSQDVMLLAVLANNLNDYNDGLEVNIKTLTTFSKGVKPLVSKAFNENARSLFTDLSAPIFDNDTHDVLKLKGLAPEAINHVVGIVKDVSLGVDPESLAEAVKSENYSYLADTIKSDAAFTKLVQGFDVIKEDPKRGNSSVTLDINSNIASVYPALAEIKDAQFEPASPNSMIAQLNLQGSIQQTNGRINKETIDFTKTPSFEDTLVSYMARNAEYLDGLSTIKLMSGAITSGAQDDPNAKAALQTLADRGVSAIHPDMYTHNVAEFADKHFPNEINNEFDAYRASPRKNMANSLDLEILVADKTGYTQAYKLSEYATPEALREQQRSDFRGNEDLSVSKVRVHNFGQDVARAIIQSSVEPLPVYPAVLPKELWTQDARSYLTNDKLIKPGELDSKKVQELVEKTQQSYKEITKPEQPVKETPAATATTAEPAPTTAPQPAPVADKPKDMRIEDNDVGMGL